MLPNDTGKTAYDELRSAARNADELDLESILAEYGGGHGQRLLRDTEELPEEPEAREPAAPPPEELPRAPRPLTLEEVVGSTVDAVLQEETVRLKKPKKGLFSRKPPRETEELPAVAPLPPEELPEGLPEEEEPEEPIGPEPDPEREAERYRMRLRRSGGLLAGAAVVAVLPVALAVTEEFGYWIPYWSGNLALQSAALGVCILLQLTLCAGVVGKAWRRLRQRSCGMELLAVVSALLAAGDCAVQLALPERTAVPGYAMVCLSALAFAQWGVNRENRALYDTLRTAAMDDEPPYLVTETERGACKQQGTLHGFYTGLTEPDLCTQWQTALAPVILMASLIFAGLSSLGLGRGSDFLLNWSAILAAGTAFGWPLCWSLPFSTLAATLQKLGAALAGWRGTEKIGRRRAMIVSEDDLFPLGAVQLNGVKVFGEELQKADSYAASMSRAAGSGLQKLFDKRLRSEGGRYREVTELCFYEEGGWSGLIRGESVLMGTASFMRKMDVRLPGNINLKTGIFLSVDGELIVVYAVKYQPADTVDRALGILRRGRILPILASRDPNVTPALLKRKFGNAVRVDYPDLVTRVALSEVEEDRGLPRALLLREGLLPYAEAVAGSCRLCTCVRRATMLTIWGSVAGTLLTFYLVFVGAYSLLTPLALEAFLLLWTLPVLLLADRAGRY